MSAPLDWEKMRGLIPAVVQDHASGEVLMVGYMNPAALERTRSTGRVTFYSRSRGELWTKGETSGNWLEFVDLEVDCDGDALLVRARPAGPVCHLGTRTCFGEDPQGGLAFLARLEALLRRRREERPAGSYTTGLFEGGVSRIAQKVGEEGVETALAAVGEDAAALTGEAADLLFHLLVLLQSRDLSLAAVIRELEERHRGA